MDGPRTMEARVLGVGVDLVSVPRMTAALDRTPTLARRLLAPGQRLEPEEPPSSRGLARHFAVKEAVMKSLGRGLGAVAFAEIAVELSGTDGAGAAVSLAGRAARRAQEQGVGSFTVELDTVLDGDGGEVVCAQVVALSQPPSTESRPSRSE